VNGATSRSFVTVREWQAGMPPGKNHRSTSRASVAMHLLAGSNPAVAILKQENTVKLDLDNVGLGLDAIEKALSKIDQEHATIQCELDHSGDPSPGPHIAVEYLRLHTKAGQIITLPYCAVCKEDLDRGNESEWQLIICFSCLSTKWVPRTKMIKRGYNFDKQILGISNQPCPFCENFSL